MSQNTDLLGTERVPVLFRKMVIPTVAAQLVNLIYNMVDRIYIGHIPDVGSLALTGVGVCMPAVTLLAAFAQLSAQAAHRKPLSFLAGTI